MSCHLQTGTVLLFLFQFGFLVLFFLVWLLWLDFQNYTEKQAMRAVISTSAMFLVLFLIFEETDFTGEYDVSCELVFYAFIKWREHHMLSDMKSLTCLLLAA